MKAHQIYVEILWHVQCCNCGKYWPMSDMKETEIATMFCPHCGFRATYTFKNGTSYAYNINNNDNTNPHNAKNVSRWR